MASIVVKLDVYVGRRRYLRQCGSEATPDRCEQLFITTAASFEAARVAFVKKCEGSRPDEWTIFALPELDDPVNLVAYLSLYGNCRRSQGQLPATAVCLCERPEQ